MRKIENPLTVIGVFAGIAEIAGTVVLPLVSIELQRVFIWYVMLFPPFLVFLFFLTLNFNRKALYSPSDFKDENNFMNLQNIILKEVSINEMGKKIQQAKTSNPQMTTMLQPIETSFQKIIETQQKEPQEIKHARTLLESMQKNSQYSFSSLIEATGLSGKIVRNTLRLLNRNHVVIMKYKDGHSVYQLNQDFFE